MRYEMVFKSNLNFQIEAFKRILRYHRVLRLILIVEILLFYPLCLLVAYKYYLKFGLLYGIYWAIYPFIIVIVLIIPHITPKTYKTHLKGLFVNGHIYKWKNFSSYFTDDRFLYLLSRFGRWEIVRVVLPKEFEEVVREFVRKRDIAV